MLSLFWVPLILSVGVFIGMVLAALFAVQDRADEAEERALMLQRGPGAHKALTSELETGHH